MMGLTRIALPSERTPPDAAGDPTWLVLCDDDTIYPSDWLAQFNLKDRPKIEVVAHRCHLMQRQADGSFRTYGLWPRGRREFLEDEEPFATGVGGIALRPSAIDPYFYESRDFLELAPTSDDVWLYFAFRQSGLKVKPSGFRFKPKTWNHFKIGRLIGKNKQVDLAGLTPNDRALRDCEESIRTHKA